MTATNLSTLARYRRYPAISIAQVSCNSSGLSISPRPFPCVLSFVSGPVPLNYGRQIRDPSDCPPVLFGVNTRKKVVSAARIKTVSEKDLAKLDAFRAFVEECGGEFDASVAYFSFKKCLHPDYDNGWMSINSQSTLKKRGIEVPLNMDQSHPSVEIAA
ncbi:hypothetical protein DFP72DRAFT_1044046 [Ephemerocybe angulata]|uniref:Uncharacterized protein n=1 Tax=Ephemerocybe angulata TaxID=980116 RepID=A0A8H6I555_9AGAR|nr:hypothetical protein DFP72DRAFT_1044046 [Tulosesus angulatus]